jgi:hypothetical protein
MLTSYKSESNDVDEEDVIETMAETKEETPVVVEEVVNVVNPANIIAFTEWIEKNNAVLTSTSDIARVKIAVADVDPASSIGFKAPNLKGEKDEAGKVKKDLFFIKDINIFNVLDLPLFHLKFYKSDLFRIIHQYSETVFIKEYSIKTGSALTFCTPIDNHLIPYAKMKVKKGSKVISVPLPDVNKITEKMNGIGDIESLILMYKQSLKFKDKLTSLKEITTWILKRYEDAIDVSHQIQIDGVLIEQVK